MSACAFFEKTESEIIEEHAPLVVYQALKFRPNKLTNFDDYMQAGYIGLLRAVRKFDPPEIPNSLPFLSYVSEDRY